MLPNWNEIKEECAEALIFCGRASPTVNIKDKTIKGWGYDPESGSYSVYYTSEELVSLANQLRLLSKYLEQRAIIQTDAIIAKKEEENGPIEAA